MISVNNVAVQFGSRKLFDEVNLKFRNLLYGFLVFLIFVFIANTMNITFYKTGIIGDETFNMFYISPYFISRLPVYDTIQKSMPYFIYLLIYLISIYLGGNIIFFEHWQNFFCIETVKIIGKHCALAEPLTVELAP